MGILGKFFGSKPPAPPCEIHPDDQDFVRPEDTQWWNSLSLDDCNAFGAEDKAFRFAAWQKFVERDGLTDAEAGRKVRLAFPGYYYRVADRTNDEFQLAGPDALLPFALRDRDCKCLFHQCANTAFDSYRAHVMRRGAGS